MVYEYDVDKDTEIQLELSELEMHVISFKSKVDKCDIKEPFIDSVGKIGGLYRKYTKFTYLPKVSRSAIRLDNAMKEFTVAQRKFATKCDCRKISTEPWEPPIPTIRER